LDAYQSTYEFVDVGNVADQDAAAFGMNPLLQVPVLIDGDAWLTDSDAIAGYVVRCLDADDRYGVQTHVPNDLAARAIMNGAMSAEVKLLLAERTGLPTEQFAFFAKARRVMENSLAWLEAQAANFDAAAPGYAEFHLVCMWEHIEHYASVPLDYPQLAQVVASVAELDCVKRSSPPSTPSGIQAE
jgi:glutathione S-transferase